MLCPPILQTGPRKGLGKYRLLTPPNEDSTIGGKKLLPAKIQALNVLVTTVTRSVRDEKGKRKPLPHNDPFPMHPLSGDNKANDMRWGKPTITPRYS